MSKLKIVIGAVLAVFFLLSTGVFTAGFVAVRKKQVREGFAAEGPTEPVDALVDPVLDAGEVSKHNAKDDCWMIISSNVYNLTKFLSQHPGGNKPVLSYCGADGTKAFSTKDLSPARGHSKLAEELMAQYLIGKLGEPLTPQPGALPNLVGPIPTTVPRAAVVPTLTAPALASPPALSMTDVSRHNSSGDCWMVISGGVYDVTGFILAHPGGVGPIAKYCGQEATEAFQSKDQNPGRNHSSYAYGLLSQYLIGNVGSPLAQLQSTSVPVQPGSSPTATPRPQLPQGSSLTITTQEVALHNTSQNCWLIISGKVYNVSSFIYQHPGGAQMIINYCGKDGTVGFETKDKGSPKNHSNTAYNMLKGYLVGSLGSTVSINLPAAASTPIPGIAGPTNTPKQERKNTASIPGSVTSKYPGAVITQQKVEDDGRQDIKLIYSGECRHIKTNKDGSIKEDKECY